MAKVPTAERGVLPDGGATPFLGTTASKENFSIMGRAMVRAGESLSQGESGLAKMAEQQNETTVNDLYSNDFSPKFRQLYQDYYALQGKDAVDQRVPFEEKMKALQNETRSTLGNQQQQRMFDSISRRRVEMELDGMARYSDQQNKVWQTDTFESTLKNLRNQASDKYNDEHAFGTTLGSGQAEIDRFAMLTGKPAEWARARADSFASNAAVDRLSRWMLDDPVAAKTWYDAHGEMIDAQARPVIEHHLKTAVLPVEAKSVAASIISGGTLNPDKAGDPVLMPVAAPPDGTGKDQAGAPQAVRDTRASLGNWVSTAESVADRMHPGDPVFRDLVVTQVKGYVNTIVAAQDGIAKQAHGALMTAAMGQAGAPKPLTLDDLLSTPDAKRAWGLTDVQSQRGILALLEHNAREAEGRPIRSNPRVVEDLFSRVHLPDDDPRKIKQPSQLAPFFTHGINRTDYDWLRKEVEQNQTADGQRLNETRNNFLSSVKPQFDKSTMLKLDEKGGEDFYKFRTYVMEQERAARAAGKNPYELFNPGSPDYIGKQIPTFQRTLDQQLKDMAESLNRKPTAPLPPEQQRKPGESVEAYRTRMGMK